MDVSRLTPVQRDELTWRRVQAAAASRRGAAGDDSKAAARSCQEAVLALSLEERRELARWMHEDLPG